tara:strand:- start:1307 stop:2251 length:945 start_codon:yes stop_codon:yes gene_type:complete
MKVNFGFWSFSSHLKNKVIPSIRQNKNINPKKILTSKNIIINNRFLKNTKVIKDKKKFLEDQDIKIVYISSISKNHFKNSLEALKYNKNVICEKPICLNYKDFKKLLLLCKKKKLKIFEVYQYIHHPLFIKIKKIIKKKEIGEISIIKSSFTIPLNDKKNFRFNNKLGGGALNDIGVYPLSIPFFLFNNPKLKILEKNILRLKNNGVDISGNVLSKINNKLFYKFNWGFNLPYTNYLRIVGSKGKMECEFIFSKKVEQSGLIKITKNNKQRIINIKKSNQINLAFNSYIFQKNINKNNKISIQILKMLEKLRKK